MTVLSSRYAAALVAILAVALVPASAQRLRPARIDPCAAPEALRATSMIAGSLPGGERVEKLGDDGHLQWSEGTIESPYRGRPPLRFALIRSFDARPLYIRSTSFIEEKLEPESQRDEEIATDRGPLPITLVTDDTGAVGRTVVYAFVYEGRPVRSPFLAQLRTALPHLLTGPRPLTLLLVSGEGPRGHREELVRRATEWLADAYEYFDDVCHPG